MAMTIVQEECTSCGDCVPVCPTGAIQKKKGLYKIDPEVCTECEGGFDEPQCVMECEVAGCIVAV
jgi:ferredoxin